MKVYVYIYIKPDNPQPGGLKFGDITYIYPIDFPQARLDLDTSRPLVVDLNISCGKNYHKVKCWQCIDNNVETCDVQFYRRMRHTKGSLFVKPKIREKRRFYVEPSVITNLYGTDFPTDVALINKVEIYRIANENVMPKSVFKEKV